MPTNFNDIKVDSENHGYAIGDKQLISVTTLVKKLAPEFDRDGISRMMAERAGKTQQQILQEWEAKGARSRDKGTRLHNYVEDVMDGRVDPILMHVNDRIPEMDAFDNVWKNLRTNLDAKVIVKEKVIGDEELGVAGRVDTILSLQPPRQECVKCVFDWKTGKFRDNNRFEMLLPPFNLESHSDLNLYSIQTSLYRLILERNSPKDKFADAYLAHLRDDGSYLIYRAVDYRSRLADWLRCGVPASIYGDPGADRRAFEIVKIMDGVDSLFIGKLSIRARRELGRIVSKITTSINAHEEADDGFIRA